MLESLIGEIGLHEISLDSLQQSKDEFKLIFPRLFDLDLNYYEKVILQIRSLKHSKVGELDILSLKKLSAFLNGLISSSSDPNGEQIS
jgi:hypothetical protein